MRVLAPRSRCMDIHTARARIGTVWSYVQDGRGATMARVEWEGGPWQSIDPSHLFPMPGARYTDIPD